MATRKNKDEGYYSMNGTASDSPRQLLNGFVKEGKKHIEFATVGAILGAALAGTSGALAGVCIVVVIDVLYDKFSSNKN
ncbi:hypothetical protein CAL7716_106230 (plasmid) [Calothrix sp. PCC 7716]|nr:hypothetical protein CAL7716_106230 [Calothrix sp. PCC 7716]